MRCFSKYLLAPSLGLLLVGTGFAQQTPSRPFPQGNAQTSFPGGFGTPLFQNPNVSQALGLTPQQRAQLNQANQNLQALFQRESGQVRINDPQRNLRMQDLRDAYHDELMQSAATIMTPQQLSRYQQLDLQNRGFDAFANTEVQRRLTLAENQVQRLQAAAQQSNQELQGIWQNGQPHPDEAWRHYEAWRWHNLNRMNGVLNEAQRQAWSQMTGQPFNFGPTYPVPNR